MQINDDQIPAQTCFQQMQSSRPVRAIVDLYQRHPSIEFTIKDIFKMSQAVAVGGCAWKATTIFDDPLRDPDEPLNSEFITTAFFATALLCTAFAASIFRHCSVRRFRKPLPHITSIVPILSAACIGILLASRQQLNSATVIWNNISDFNTQTEYINIKNNQLFRERIQSCFNDLGFNRELYTLPGCYGCEYSSGYTWISWETFHHSFDQLRMIKINQTLCPPAPDTPAYKWWSSFKSLDFNQTNGPWPCIPDWGSGDPDTNIAVANVLAQSLSLGPPLSITVTPLANTSCVYVEGVATQFFIVSSVCGYDSEKFKQLPPGFFTCLTPSAIEYLENYTSNFEPYVALLNKTYPKLVKELVDGNWIYYQYLLAGYLGLTSGVITSLIRTRCKCCFREENQPLLAPNAQQA